MGVTPPTFGRDRDVLQNQNHLLFFKLVIPVGVEAPECYQELLLQCAHQCFEEKRNEFVMVDSFIPVRIDLMENPLSDYFWQVQVLLGSCRTEVVFMLSLYQSKVNTA
jgi:hypothetical protein